MAHQSLVEFIKVLRGAGVNVSPADTLEAAHATDILGFDDRQSLKTALSLILAKSQAEKQLFATTFDQFFSFAPPDTRQSIENDNTTAIPPSMEQLSSVSRGPQFGNAASPNHGNNDYPQASELGELLLSDDVPSLTMKMAQAFQAEAVWKIRVITQKGLFARRVMQAMGNDELSSEIHQLEQLATAPTLSRAQALKKARTRLRDDVIDHINRQFLMHAREHRETIREETMRSINLRDLSEFREVRTLVETMARRLARLHQRRYQKARRGKLDMGNTLKAAIHHQGVPLTLRWKRQKKGKTELFVICDVSSSVASAARFLLMFIYALNDVLPRVRSFVFASRFVEVTDYFSNLPAEQAIATILDTYGGSGTNYAGMLDDFRKDYAMQMSQRSSLIILGDARNNGLPAGQENLSVLKQQCRHLFWLNPESKARWDTGDSVMSLYQPYCTRATSCRNLNQLQRFVDHLLRDARD